MKTTTIVLTPDAMRFLEEWALRGLLDAASELAELSPHQHPDSYPKALASVRAGVLALADIWMQGAGDAVDDGESSTGYVAKYLAKVYDPAQLQAMRDGGLDPAKELGPHDPRAARPRCIHGMLFSETCEHCENEESGPAGIG